MEDIKIEDIKNEEIKTEDIKNEKVKKTNKDYLKKFYEKYPEKRTADIVCEGRGQTYKYTSKCTHLKSKKHRIICEMLEKKN